ncbi:MAG: RNA polymerase sigma factor SigJ [Actinomycetota bacterium]|nr:RNA polymerase sigma factor SigJ [Actinomycetota bacterium]
MTDDGATRASVAATAAATFEAERSRLHAVAYRMLGSVADAEDVVQDTWLRWHRLGEAGRAEVRLPAAWFTTVASRLALDRLKSAQRQREEYIGPWLAEPVLTDGDPAVATELAESLTLGFLAVLERLSPVERAVFLLADVFGEPYAAIAAIVDRSDEACRQIASRARRRVREQHRRPAGATRRPASSDPSHRDDLVHAFAAACAFGDLDGLRRMLADDVVLVSDGGRDVHAARRPVLGAHRVTRLLANLAKRMPADTEVAVHAVNAEPGLVLSRGGRPWMVMALETDGGRIVAIRMVINPAKLRRLVSPLP